MGLEFIYSDPQGLSQPSVSSNIGAEAVRWGTVSLTQAADVGNPSTSRLDVDDPTGIITLGGWRIMRVRETSAPSNNTIVWGGVIGDREFTRGGSMLTGSARMVGADLVDASFVLNQSMLNDASAKRPDETSGDRLRWLLGSKHCHFDDYGHVTYPLIAMDANDYRGSKHGDVLNDIALATGYNYWAELNEAHLNRHELFMFDPNNSSVYQSALHVSNVLSDYDGASTFMPYRDAAMRRSPSRIAYGVRLPYANGAVYVVNEPVGEQFARVDQTAPMATVKKASTAAIRASRFLAQHDTEEDALSFSVDVPAALVNGIRAGHALPVKFQHLPGYEDWTWVRVVNRTVVQDAEGALPGHYRLIVQAVGLYPAASADHVYQTVTVAWQNTVVEDTIRNGAAYSTGASVQIGSFWRYTLSQPGSHDLDAYTETMRISVGSQYFFDHSLGYPMPAPQPGPPYGPMPAYTGTFTSSAAPGSEFTCQAGTNGYVTSYDALRDDAWLAVFERLSP